MNLFLNIILYILYLLSALAPLLFLPFFHFNNNDKLSPLITIPHSLILIYAFLTINCFLKICLYELNLRSKDNQKNILESFQNSQLVLIISFISIFFIFQDSNIENIVFLQNQNISSGIGIFNKWGIFLTPITGIAYFISIYISSMKFPFNIDDATSSETKGRKWINHIYFIVAFIVGINLFFGGATHLLPFTFSINSITGIESAIIIIFNILIKIFCILIIFFLIQRKLLKFSTNEIFLLSWKLFFPLSLINLIVIMLLKYYLVV
ncbi:MAG: NADH-quinone oxidoreductase subunit H [Oligoflexia bacterium]|nr:NADH-quinone oxidoreductase subunit H [Oligoflexia bacterium]